MQARAAFSTIYDIALLITLWATALGLGMLAGPRQVVAAARPTSRLLRVLALNILGIPLLAWAITSWLPVGAGYATGLLLVAFTSGGPLGLKLSQIAGGDVSLTIALVVILETLNVLVLPIWAALLLSGGGGSQVAFTARTLALYVLLPLALGWLIRQKYPARTGRWTAACNRLSTLTLAVVIVLALYLSLNTLAALLGSWAPSCILLMLAASLAAGYVLSGPQAAGRRAGAIATATRAGSLALLIARAAYKDRPEVTATVIVFSVLGLLVLSGVSLALGRRPVTAELSTASAD